MKKKLVLMTSALMAISLLAGCNNHTHEWGDVSYTWAEDNSTCTATRVCKGDESHVETETVDTTSVIVTEAKCEEDGLKRYTADFKTNEAFLDQTKDVTLEAFGHEWGTPTYTWSNDYSSCTATRVCKNDSNHIESETADSAYTEIIPATCDTDGSAVYDVAFENEAFEVQTHEIVLPATGHSWGTPTYTWSDDNSTCTATRVCTKDANHIDTETVDAVITPYEEPDCTNDGYGKYTATFTNEAFAVQEKDAVIARLGHDWGTPTYVWANDNSTCTARRVCAHDATHVDTETVNTTYAVVTEATCTDNGVGRYTATFSTTAFAVQTKDVDIEINPDAHEWGEPTYVWAEDNSTVTATRVCTKDSSHTETETVDSTYAVVTAATYEADGLGRYTTVAFNNEAFATQTKDVTLKYHGESPCISEDGKTVVYGLYPQTHVSDSTLLTALDALDDSAIASNGYYFYNDEYYVKKSANPFSSDYTFSDGTTIASGTNYWFKCEPIVWDILSNSDDTYYLVSDIIIDANQAYYSSTSSRTVNGSKVYANNYMYSNIRAWLNGYDGSSYNVSDYSSNSFYSQAFGLNDSYLTTMTVDNSASTTNSSSNSYACANTNDKISLLSYKDVFSTYYSSNSERQCSGSDYAKANHLYIDTSTGYSYWWLRSPSSFDSGNAYSVYYTGGSYNNRIYYDGSSVRPAITITIN